MLKLVSSHLIPAAEVGAIFFLDNRGQSKPDARTLRTKQKSVLSCSAPRYESSCSSQGVCSHCHNQTEPGLLLRYLHNAVANGH